MKALAVFVAAAALLAPFAAHAEESTPRYPPSSVRLKLVAGGLVVAGGAYGAALLSSTVWPEVPGSDVLKIPVAGPWLALGKSGCATDEPDCGTGTLVVRGILLVLDGVAQIGGLGLVGEGIFMKTESGAPAKQRPALGFRQGELTIQPTPIVSARFTGLGFVGTF